MLANPSQLFPSSFVGTSAGIAASTYLFSAWDDDRTRIFGTDVLGLLVTMFAVPSCHGEKLRIMEKLAESGNVAVARSFYKPLGHVSAA